MNPNETTTPAVAKKRRQLDRGMTLLEIMVVITIIGAVMAIVGVNVLNQLENARVDTTRQSMGNIEQALKLYKMRNNKYPDSFSALVQEKYLDQVPKDGWSNEFVYMREGSKYKIVSYGADGTPGGDGTDADITSGDTVGAK